MFRRGVTLVELLVVIGILVLLAAFTIPRFRAGTERRRVREAARMVEGFITAAKTSARVKKFAVGVQFVRSPEHPELSVVLRQCESPPIYTGQDDSSRFTVRSLGGDVVELVSSPGALHPDVIKAGDSIEFGLWGWRPGAPAYRIDSLTTDGTTGITTARATLITMQYGSVVPGPLRLPWPTSEPSSPQLFAIKRQPAPSTSILAVKPLTLPMRTCVDLDASGTDSTPFAGTADVSIMFRPNGTVEQVLGVANVSPVGPFHLSVRAEPADDTAEVERVELR